MKPGVGDSPLGSSDFMGSAQCHANRGAHAHRKGTSTRSVAPCAESLRCLTVPIQPVEEVCDAAGRHRDARVGGSVIQVDGVTIGF